jgi:transposase-like protein
MGAVEVRWVKDTEGVDPEAQRYGGRLRLAVGNRTTSVLESFIEGAVAPGSVVYTDGAEGYKWISNLGYGHVPVVIGGSEYKAGFYLNIIHLIFSNLWTWLNGTHHGVEEWHLQAYLNEFTFRFNRRFSPPERTFRTLLGFASAITGPTYDGLYRGDWKHPRCW